MPGGFWAYSACARRVAWLICEHTGRVGDSRRGSLRWRLLVMLLGWNDVLETIEVLLCTVPFEGGVRNQERTE